MRKEPLIVAAGVLGALGIIARALEAHGLVLPFSDSAARLRDFSQASDLVMLHALALLGLCSLADTLPRSGTWIAAIFLLGTILFAAPLYVYALSGSRALIVLTPFGGTLLILGWAGLALCGLLRWTRKNQAR